MKPQHISELIDQLQATGKLPSGKPAKKDLSLEAWEIFQKIGQPQQGQEAQASWDAMQEKHLAQVEREIEELENTPTTEQAAGDMSYEERVNELEAEGLTRSDAQGVVDAEDKAEETS